MNQEPADVIEALLRRIPDKWQRVDTEQLSSAEQQALLRLVGAGLVERRNTLRLDMAGQSEAFEATIAVTGEAGLLQAIEVARPFGSGIQKYVAAIRNPQVDWSPWENVVREQLPVQKLETRLLASLKLSQGELNQALRDRFERHLGKLTKGRDAVKVRLVIE